MEADPHRTNMDMRICSLAVRQMQMKTRIMYHHAPNRMAKIGK